MGSKKAESVKVVVRCRPLVSSEKTAGYTRVVEMDVSRGMVVLQKPSPSRDEPPREFTFDSVYDWNSRQIDLYDETVRPIVDAVLQGYNGTVFAYGQTGTGKTYTMEGVSTSIEERGVIPNSFAHIFNHINSSENEQYLVRASYLEIYQDEIRDLLSKDQTKHLELKERPDTGVYVKDLSSFVAKNVKEIEHVMTVGNQNRSVGRTDMNEHSSRSHAIFIVTVECSAKGVDGKEHIRVGKLNLVDLAGSERQSKTGSTGERFKEATKINLSLSALSNVISSLVDGRSTHVPYRDSKLTRLLQDSLGGNAKTVMIANIGPASYNFDETVNTLRYANRAKNIKNKPRINEDPKDALLREYQEEIQRLKHALEKRQKTGGRKKKRRRRIGVNGEEIIEEGDSGEEGDDGARRDDRGLKAQQAKLEAERQAILQNNELLEEERERLLSGVQRHVEDIKKEQKKRDHIASKIKAMESKLLAGGTDIISRRDEQQRFLEQQRQEMIEQRQRERQIVQQLEEQEESRMELHGEHASLQEEVDSKKKKLKKLQHKLRIAEVEIKDQREEQTIMREELAQQLEELEKVLKFKMLVLENFVSSKDIERLSSRAVFDEEADGWVIIPQEIPSAKSEASPRPVSVPGLVRPMCSQAMQGSVRGDPRYMADNILKLELDLPTRTTSEYEGPGVVSTVQAMLDQVVEDEEETITVDAIPFCKDKRLHTAKRSKSRLKNARQEQIIAVDPKEQFPQSRGLVTASKRYA